MKTPMVVVVEEPSLLAVRPCPVSPFMALFDVGLGVGYLSAVGGMGNPPNSVYKSYDRWFIHRTLITILVEVVEVVFL